MGEVSVDEVGEDRERDVEVDGERDLGAERVEVEGADLFGELVLDPPAFGVALDQLLGGEVLAVGEQQRWLVAARPLTASWRKVRPLSVTGCSW